jgi:hypothetical protein
MGGLGGGDAGEDAGAFGVGLVEAEAGLPRVLVGAMAGDAFFAEQGADVPLEVGGFGPKGEGQQSKRQPTQHGVPIVSPQSS